MQQCAFCLNEADLTGEHIWSDWMKQLLPSQRTISGHEYERDW